MFHSRTHIEEGDLVILYMVRTDMAAITVKPGQVLHNKYGRYHHADMIGMKYGSKMHSPPPQSGYIYLLRPTPELWTLSLPHRTQILYHTDIAYIIMRLGVRVGGKVIEAGTGSGSMTHSLSRAVGGKGYVGSYEYHATRFDKAKAEFEQHGLTNVRLQHRNVCKEGFGDVDNVESVFLDLPAPWEAIPHAVKVFRPEVIGKICCFSPCLEQVLKTVSTLRENGFSDISTQEVLVRTHELQAPPLPGSSHLRSIDDIISDLSAHEKKKEERRLYQMRTAREKARKIRVEKGMAADPGGVNLEMELGEMLKEELSKDVGDTEVVVVPEFSNKRKAVDLSVASGEAPVKKSKVEESGPTDKTALPTTSATGSTSAPPKSRSPRQPRTNTLSSQLLLRISPEMRGHTSYLTFATYYPTDIREAITAQSGRATKATSPEPAAPAVAEPAKAATSGSKQAPISVIETETETETEYGDPAMEAAIGTLTEEEMIGLLGT